MARVPQGPSGEVRRDQNEQSGVRHEILLQLAPDKEKHLSMRDVADYMDGAAPQCRDAGLEIYLTPSSSTSTSSTREHRLKDKPICCSIELLYPNVVVRQGQEQGRIGRGRGSHEVQHSDAWFSEWPLADAMEQHMAEWIRPCGGRRGEPVL